VSSELEKYNLDQVAVQEVRWVEGGGQTADIYTFLYRNGDTDHHSGTGFFIYKGIISAVKRVEFTSDRLLYITFRG
jgi:hypothetical protein